MNRRTFMASTATALGGLGAGTILMNQSTTNAAASVSMGSLAMSGDKTTTDDGNIANVTATVDGTWQYELPGGSPTEWLVQLRVSDGDKWAVVGQDSGSVSYAMYEGDYSVSGSVTQTSVFDASYFAAPEQGTQKAVELPVQIWFRVLDSDGTALASTKLDDTATVTVAQEAIDASLYGEVQGSGGLTVEK